MAEYIEREAAIKDLLNGIIEVTTEDNDTFPQVAVESYRAVIVKYLLSLPAANVRENVPGEWEHLGCDEWCCSVCGNVIHTEGSWEHPHERGDFFCPNCGADMRGDT